MNTSTISILVVLLSFHVYRGSARLDFECGMKLIGKLRELKPDTLNHCYKEENLEQVKSIYKSFADKVPHYCRNPSASENIRKCVTFYVAMFNNRTETAEIRKGVHKLLEGGQHCFKAFLDDFGPKHIVEFIQKTCGDETKS